MPEIKELLELRFKVPGSRQSLRVREARPISASNSFIATQAPTALNPATSKDYGVMSKNSSAGLAIDEFYSGVSILRDHIVGNALYIKSSANQIVTIVELDDN